jgi:hypothetical protein
MSAKLTITIPEWLDRVCVWPVMWYRRRKYGYDFRKIYLGEGEWTILDQKDYYCLGSFKWTINGNGRKFYATRFVKIGPGKTKTLRLHREIMQAPKDLLVDHRNGEAWTIAGKICVWQHIPRTPVIVKYTKKEVHRSSEGSNLERKKADGSA